MAKITHEPHTVCAVQSSSSQIGIRLSMEAIQVPKIRKGIHTGHWHDLNVRAQILSGCTLRLQYPTKMSRF